MYLDVVTLTVSILVNARVHKLNLTNFVGRANIFLKKINSRQNRNVWLPEDAENVFVLVFTNSWAITKYVQK